MRNFIFLFFSFFLTFLLPPLSSPFLSVKRYVFPPPPLPLDLVLPHSNARQIERVRTGGIFDFLLLLLLDLAPPPSPPPLTFTLSAGNLPAPLFSLLELLKTRKSKNREARPTRREIFLSSTSPRFFNGPATLPDLSLSLSLCLPPHSPPLSRPRKGPSSSSSSSIPSFLLLARFSPFFHHGLLSGVLNPFFPRQLPRNSCIRVGRPDSRRALARDSFV